MQPAPSEEHPRRGAVLLAMNACMFIFGAVLLLMGSLLPQLHVTGNRAGGLGSFPLVGILTATILIGPVLDKAGAKAALVLALVMVAAAIAAMPSLSSYPALACAALIYGFGGGILNTATNALVSVLSEAGRGAALNVLGCSFSLGAVAAPLLMSLASGQWAVSATLYLLASAPALALLLVLPLRFPPEHSGTPIAGLLRTLRHPTVWLIALLLFFESGNENCMFVWAAGIAASRLHVPAARADVALVALAVALGAGRFAAAIALKRIGSRRMLLLASSVTFIGAVMARTASAFDGYVAAVALIGLGMSAVFPTALGVAGDRFPGETGTVFGAVIAVALVGGTAGPVLGGSIAARNPAAVLLVPLIAPVAIAALSMAAVRANTLSPNSR